MKAIALLLVLALITTGCGKKDAVATSAAPFRITVQLDWVPEPEHGGFFQAQARGFFQEAGLEIELVP